MMMKKVLFSLVLLSLSVAVVIGVVNANDPTRSSAKQPVVSEPTSDATPSFKSAQTVKPRSPERKIIPVHQFGRGFFYALQGAEPKHFVVLLSSSKGWDAQAAKSAQALAADGDIVLGLDVRAYYANRAKSKDTCLFPAGIIEDISQTLQKEFVQKEYNPPIIIGLGDSGGLAAAVVMQTLPSTNDGAIAPQFCNQIKAPKPICDGARLSHDKNKYRPEKAVDLEMGEFFHLGLDAQCESAKKEWPVGETVTDVNAFLLSSLHDDDVAREGSSLSELKAYPLAYLPSDKNDWIVIFVSGDGGWRDIDRQIGDALQESGYAVIGIDSLRYFWNTKTPQDVAAMMDDIVGTSKKMWGKKKVMIAGYSFGADVIPFALPRMKTAKEVEALGLIGLSKDALFEITVGSFLGEGDPSLNVPTAVSKLRPVPTLCIYGSEEEVDEDTICPLLNEAWVKKVKFEGDHHYNEAYKDIAKTMMQMMR